MVKIYCAFSKNVVSVSKEMNAPAESTPHGFNVKVVMASFTFNV